jgi:hypothetical protein
MHHTAVILIHIACKCMGQHCILCLGPAVLKSLNIAMPPTLSGPGTLLCIIKALQLPCAYCKEATRQGFALWHDV